MLQLSRCKANVNRLTANLNNSVKNKPWWLRSGNLQAIFPTGFNFAARLYWTV